MSEKPEPPLPPAPSPADVARAEAMLKEASILRIRKRYAEARKLVEEAYETAPGSPSVLESLGDYYKDLGAAAKARELYKTALRLSPNSVPIERKYAEAVLAQVTYSDPSILFDADEIPIENLANAKAAMLLGLALPGLGHTVLGIQPKGGLFILAWAAFLGLALAIPGGLSGIGNLFKPSGGPVNSWVFVPLLGMVVTYLWALAEMAALAKRAEVRKIVRPIPPDEGGIDV